MNANGNADYYTAKYAAADGALVWEKRYNGTGNGNDYGHGVAMDTAGNVLVTGASERSSGNSALYQRGAVSIGAATQVAGLKRFEFEAALTERQIERNYGADDLASDVAWANSVS